MTAVRSPIVRGLSAGLFVLLFLAAASLVVGNDAPQRFRRVSGAGRTAYRQALEWLEQGQAAKALEAINSALGRDPSDSRLYNLRGLAHSILGERAKAEADFRKVIQLAPQSTTGYNNLATLLSQQGEKVEAAQLFATALKISPRDFTALAGLGTVRLNEGNAQGACPLLQRAWAERPGDFQTGYELALTLRELKRPAAARRIVQKLPAPHERKLAAKYYALQATIARDLHDPQAAVLQYQEAFGYSPQAFDIYFALVQTCLEVTRCQPGPSLARAPASLSPGQHFALGLLLAMRGFKTLAIPQFEATLRQAPESYSAAYDLAVVQEESGYSDAAIRTLNSLIERRPEAGLYNLRASAEEEKGLYVQAVRDFRRAVDMDPASEKYFFDLGAEYLAHFTFAPALQVFRDGAGRFPSAAREFVGLGFALYARQDYLRAAQAFLHALEISPRSRAALNAYGSLIEQVVPDHWDALRPQLKRLAETYPRSAPAVYCYGASLFGHAVSHGDHADFRQAQTLLEQAVRLEPDFAAAHLSLGNLFAAERDYPGALREFRVVVRLEPQSATGHYHLAQIYRDLGRIGPAEKELEKYTRLTQAKEERMVRTRAAIRQFVLAERSPRRVIRSTAPASRAKPE